MKLPALLFAAAALATSAFLSTARAEASTVRIRVEQESKSDNSKDRKTQQRTLKITIASGATESLDLRLVYAFFGRGAKSHDNTVVASGDMTTTLHPGTEQTLTSATKSATLIDEHFDKKKKVEASGNRFTGYGVKVFKGAEVIAEAFEPPSMKDEMGKVPNPPVKKPKAPAPAPKK